MLGPQEVRQLSLPLWSSCLVLHSRVQGCPARRPLLAGPHSGPEPQVSMLGWNKGVNIYNFIPVVRREGQQNAVFYGDTDVYFDNSNYRLSIVRSTQAPPAGRLVMQRELN